MNVYILIKSFSVVRSTVHGGSLDSVALKFKCFTNIYELDLTHRRAGFETWRQQCLETSDLSSVTSIWLCLLLCLWFL